MKGIKKYLVYGSMAMVLSVGSVACTKEGLENRIPMGYVEVALNWDSSFDPDANSSVNEAGEAVADGGRIYFYPASGSGAPICKDCNCTESGEHIFKGMIPAGDYKVVVMNRNFKNARLQNEDNYDNARIEVVKASEAIAITKADANSLIGEPAAVFMSNTLDDDRFREVFTVNNLDTIQTQASPKLMIRRVRFVITLEDFSASACRGIFGGVAASLKCATCQCLPTSAHVSFQTEVDPRNPNVFRASFNVFDLITPDEQTHMLELTLTIDGVDRTTSVDLSGDVKRELDKGEFTYEMPLNLNVKVTHTIDGDIYASVEGWDNSGTGSGTGSY